MGVFSAGGIHVHPQDPDTGKFFIQSCLHLLGSQTKGRHMGLSAHRTLPGKCGLVPAIMAAKPPVSVISEGDIAVGTFDHRTAASAGDKAREAPAV